MLTAGCHWLSPEGPNCPEGTCQSSVSQTSIGTSPQPPRSSLAGDAVHGHAVKRVWKCHSQINKVCVYEEYLAITKNVHTFNNILLY